MILTALLVAALILAIVDQAIARGRSILAWAVIIALAALLYARLG